MKGSALRTCTKKTPRLVCRYERRSARVVSVVFGHSFRPIASAMLLRSSDFLEVIRAKEQIQYDTRFDSDDKWA